MSRRDLFGDVLLDDQGEPVAILGRPDFGNPAFGRTQATKFPTYVFSVSKNAALVHRIAGVELAWYRPHYDRLLRLRQPRMIAQLVCGDFRFLTADRTRTCMIPAPDAILCGRCHGEVAPFGKNGWARKQGVSRQWANVQLGCVVMGY